MGAIVDGIFLGLLLSGMIGPIFFYMINIGLNGGVWRGMMVSAGAFLSDLVLIALIYFFSSKINFPSSASYLNFIGGGIFFFVGLGGFLKRKGNSGKWGHIFTIKDRGYKPFIYGVLINTFNPGVIIFWVGAMSTALAKYNEGANIYSYFLAAVLSVICIDFVKIYFSVKTLHSINPKIYGKITPIVSLVLLVFGLNLLRKGIWP